MIDYIIVGAGLSGACLAFRLEKAGKSFVVFDDGSQQASKVAGGLINPVILKRFTLAWKADEQLEKAIPFYKSLEEHLKMSFLRPLEIYRRFFSVEEQNNWFSASDNPNLAPFLDTKLVPQVNEYISGDFSFGRVLNTFRIELRPMLNAYAEYLKEKKCLINATFDTQKVELQEDGVQYENISAKNVIFCEGFGLQKNKFFNYLPLKGNKGEYVIIKAPQLQLEAAIKSSVFIFPLGDDLYAVGATYNNSDTSTRPTSEAKESLLKKLKEFVSVEFEVVNQIAGIRPTTIDRRPLVGQHPQYNNLFVCNGFGSRGILMSPVISEELLNHIEKGASLDAHSDISRFTKKWYKKN